MNVNITGVYDYTLIVDSNLFEDVKLLQTGLSSLSDDLFNIYYIIDIYFYIFITFFYCWFLP